MMASVKGSLARVAQKAVGLLPWGIHPIRMATERQAALRVETRVAVEQRLQRLGSD